MGGVGKNPPLRRVAADVWGDAYMQFMGTNRTLADGTLLDSNNRPITMRAAAECRYCRSPRQHDHSTCPTCGAPYPA